LMQEPDQSQTGSSVNRKLAERGVNVDRETHAAAQRSKGCHHARWQSSRVQPCKRLVEGPQRLSSSKGLGQILGIWVCALHKRQQYGEVTAIIGGQLMDAVA